MAHPSVLGISPNCSVAASRLDVAILEATMLWPDEEKSRGLAIDAARARFGRGLMRLGLLTRGEEERLLDLAIEAPRQQDLIEKAKAPFVNGFVAGLILHRALALQEINPDEAAIGR